MKHSEFVSNFIDLEEREDLFAYRVKGRVIWDYLRYPYFYHLLSRVVRGNEISFSPAPGRQRLGPRVREGFEHLRSAVYGRRPAACDIVIVNYERKQRCDGKNVNATFYPIAEAIHDRHRVVLMDPSAYSEAVEENYPCEVRRSRLLNQRARLKSRLIRYSSSERDVFTKFSDIFRTAFGDAPAIDYLVRNYVSHQLALQREYELLFAKLQPRVVLHADTGNCKGWIEAAHDAGIVVVDCQHSLMSRDNILYRYPPSVSRYELKTLSDYILTFGEFWHREYSLPASLVAVGFPYLEGAVREARERHASRGEDIVVISSMHSGKKLEQIALKLSELLPEHRVIYKLRPEEYARWREVYSPELAAKPNIHVVDDNSLSLYEIFARSGYQIGINSTALIEGLAFDLDTFIVKDGWYSEMSTLIDAGLVTLVETAEEIASGVRDHPVAETGRARDLLFKDGSVENILCFLDNLLDGSDSDFGGVSVAGGERSLHRRRHGR